MKKTKWASLIGVIATIIIFQQNALSYSLSNNVYDHYDPLILEKYYERAAHLEIQQLLEMTNDKNEDVVYLDILVDPHSFEDALAIGVREYEPDTYGDYILINSNVFPIKKAATEKGIVLIESKGYEAVIMRGEMNFKQGFGDFIVDYLNKGVYIK